MPATAARVVGLARRPDVRLDRLAEAVAADPGLASEVLRIANSPAFGRVRAVASVEEAVVVVGVAEIHSMALAMTMLASFRSDHELSTDLHEASVVTGCIASAVARGLNVERRLAFLSGLLAEIGALACLAVDGGPYGELYRTYEDDPVSRAAAEVRRYGATSREIGARLLSENALPEAIVEAVGAVDGASGRLAALTAFARRATAMLLAHARDADTTGLSSALDAIAGACSIDLPPGQLLDTCLAAARTAGQTIALNR